MIEYTDIYQVRLMLEAQLKSNAHIHWVGGYVYGRTANDDPYIILYPASDNLNHKVCRVYDNGLKRLPAFIDISNIPGDTDNNPDKDKAMKRGIYHKCPAFKVVTYDGKETQMGPEKRFSGVLWAPAPQTAVSSPPPPPPAPPTAVSRPTPQPAADRDVLYHRDQAAIAEERDHFFAAAFAYITGGETESCYGTQENVVAIADLLAPNWQPGEEKHNIAMLDALATYCTKRREKEAAGADVRVAHGYGLTEAGNQLRKAK